MRRLLALAALGLPAAAQTASFQGLGDLPGSDFYSLAYDVSADGAVVVGRSRSVDTSGSSSYEAFRWTADGGMVGLGRLPGGDIRYTSEAFAASADGSVVVGVSPQRGSEFYAFRWTADGGMVSLGRLSDARDSGARGVSADGAVVVGSSGPAAFRWTASEGLQRIVSLLVAAGVDVSGWTLTEARGVSDDGTVIVGNGLNPQGQTEAWRVVRPLTVVSADPAPEVGSGFAVTVSPNPVRDVRRCASASPPPGR